MKKLFTFVVMAVFAIGTVLANWQPSDTEAIRLDKEGADGQTQMKTLRTDDGKIVLTWLRGERADGVFSYKLHLQVFDARGNALFGDEGIIVCDKPTRTWTTDYALALAANGDILLAYTDIRNDPSEENAETYIYRYTQQGNPVWPADGILFPAGKTHENALSVEDIAPQICVSGDNIYVVASHTEYYMEEANENNWQPSPWFPNQQMPDSVLVNGGGWMVKLMNDAGEFTSDETLVIDSKMLTMNAAPDGRVYMLTENKELGLDARLLTPELQNAWEEPVTIENRPISGGMFVPTPLTEVDDNDVLLISYRALNDFYGYQVINYLNANGEHAEDPVSLNGSIDGDAGIAKMGVKENRAFVAWEWAYSSSEYYLNANVVDDQNNYVWTGEYTFGVPLELTFDWGFTPVKVIPVVDGWVLLYGISTSWNGADFMVTKIDEFGEVIWLKQICEDDFKSSGFSVEYDAKNAYIFYTQETQYDDNWNEIPGSSGMYVMCVDISGQQTAINEVEARSSVVSTEIYTIDGRRVSELKNGINIVRTTDSNGNVTTTKVLH